MGAEPQILNGEKQGPLSTGSELLKLDKLHRVDGDLGVTDARESRVWTLMLMKPQKIRDVEARANGVMKDSEG